MKTYDEYMDNIQKKAKKIKTHRRVLISTVTAVCAVAICTTLFWPLDNGNRALAKYKDSPYFDLIEQIHADQNKGKIYRNNFEKLAANLKNLTLGISDPNNYGVMTPELDGMAGTGNNGQDGSHAGGQTYQEVTDNQVDGVTEGDIFKRSDRYIYHLFGMRELRVYSIAGEQSQCVGTFSIRTPITYGTDRVWKGERGDPYWSNPNMYLSEDCTRLTIVGNITGIYAESGKYEKLIGVLSLDVSDPSNIRVAKITYFSGNGVTSRMVDGKLLLMYRYKVDQAPDFDDPCNFVPSYGEAENMQVISPQDIVCPDDPTESTYTVTALLSEDGSQVLDIHAIFDCATVTYVSKDTIYFASPKSNYTKSSILDNGTRTSQTEITGISYAAGTLETAGTITIDGIVLNQYSMDEYEGILRVATTTSVVQEKRYDDLTITTSLSREINCNLYCIDLSDWTVAASVIGFAPVGDHVTSARFDGTAAYICTTDVRLNDPVYFFDLSDLTDITWKNTPIIEGFSSSLIQFGDYLLGVGENKRGLLKVEVYAQGEDAVEAIATYEPDAMALTYYQYKSFYIDREAGLFAIPMNKINTNEWCYVLLHFDGETLQEVMTVTLDDGYYAGYYARATVIDGYFYVLDGGLHVIKL